MSTSSVISGDLAVALVVEGAVSEDMAAQCAALGLRISSQPSSIPGAAAVLLAGAAEEAAVRRGLAEPFQGFLQLGDEGILGVGFRCLETARAGGFALSLLTRQAYGLNTLDLVSEAIRRNFGFPSGEVADLMDICVGEALGNAVIHGNLGIPSHLRTTAEGFEEFRAILRERLADPILACRRVEICVRPLGKDHLCISVSDQGHGFDLATQLARSVQSSAKCGRGLGLIRRLCASVLGEDGGRTLSMTFARHG